MAGVLAAVVLGGSDSPDSPEPPARTAEPQVPPPSPPSAREPEPEPEGPAPEGRLATGLTERNASLLFADGARAVDAGLEPSRARVTRLRPAYYRLVDRLGRSCSRRRGGPPTLARTDDGCLRGIAPCGAYAGVRDQLRAVASQQRAGRGWEVVVRALRRARLGRRIRPAAASDRGSRPARGRSPPPACGATGGSSATWMRWRPPKGVALRWWAPWNEPNQPFFISPQRAACSTSSPALAPRVYARLVRAARAELRELGGQRDLVLGELAGFDGPRPLGAGIAEFVRALPRDVACAGAVWSQHAYAEPGAADRAGPVGQLKRALARRACTRSVPIWVTETGVGGARSGDERDTSTRELRRGCRILDALLRRWYRDERVDAAFQYTYREDTVFPVGLADAGLTRLYPTFGLWRAWGGERDPAGPPPSSPCAA